jgi:magnesium-transporting ATPase (P-type)
MIRIQITHPNSNGEDISKSLPNGVTSPPDNGAVDVVVKTGFETSQGSLVRSTPQLANIVFPSTRPTQQHKINLNPSRPMQDLSNLAVLGRRYFRV